MKELCQKLLREEKIRNVLRTIKRLMEINRMEKDKDKEFQKIVNKMRKQKSVMKIKSVKFVNRI